MVDTSPRRDIHGFPGIVRREERYPMPVHLTPTELADELNMKRREVLSKCIEMNVPVLKGRIDKTLFESSLRAMQAGDKGATA
jgi:hypothetical protein